MVGLMLLASPVFAQLKVGNDINLNAAGTIGVGYNADSGTAQSSDHSLGLSGTGQVTGYFYNPAFLNFYASPSYDRSQANSGSGSITDATSIILGAGIFSGSRFPGSISYGKSINSTGTYGTPGLPEFTTKGNSNEFSVGWSALVPKWPPITVQYSQTDTSSSVFGTDQEFHGTSRIFNLNSSYKLAGWMMTGRFTDIVSHTEVPSFLVTGAANASDDSSSTFNFNAYHKLPFRGSIALNYAHASFDGSGGGSSVSGSDNTFTASSSFAPSKRFSTNLQLEYDSNLEGYVERQLINSGSLVPQVNLGSDSHSLLFSNIDNFAIYKNLNASFVFLRSQQTAYGESVTANHVSAIVNYRFIKPLWGSILVYGGVNDQSTETGHQGTSLTTGINFERYIHNFDITGSFSYDQDVQTVLATQTTSSYTYMAGARRSLTRNLRWNSNFSGYHTGFGEIAGSSSHSENVGSNLSYKGTGGGVSYGQSTGTALVTASGLVAVPTSLTPVLSGNQYILENGSSISFTAVTTPIKLWTLSANYSKSLSRTATPSINSSNTSKIFTVFTQYQLRKLALTAGYTRLMQDVGSSTPIPLSYTSYYFGIQRWFKAF